MSPMERAQLAREMICHEDELVNNRVTWFLITQGILFGAFGAAAKTLVADDHPITDPAARWLGFIFTVLLCAFGLYMSLVVGRLLSNANDQLDKIDAWYAGFEDREDLPAGLRGSIGADIVARILKVEHIPTVVALIWLTLGAVSIAGGFLVHPAGPPGSGRQAARPPAAAPLAVGPPRA